MNDLGVQNGEWIMRTEWWMILMNVQFECTKTIMQAEQMKQILLPRKINHIQLASSFVEIG